MRCALVLVMAAAVVAGSGPPAGAAEEFWAQVTFVRGSATFRPSGGGAEQAVRLGSVLHQGDVVRAAEGGQVSFLLSSGGVLVVRPGHETALGSGAPAEGPSLPSVAVNLSRTLLAREGDNPMLKHLGGLRSAGRSVALAPNRTKVRSGPVRLAWTPAPGVSSFAVAVMGPQASVYEARVAGTSLEVPADQLQPGATYFWEVRDAASADSFTALGSAGFTTLDRAADDEVRALESSLSQAFPAGGEDGSPLFLRYQVLRQHGLGLEALAALEALRARVGADPELERWRGDLLEELGLKAEDLPALLPAPG